MKDVMKKDRRAWKETEMEELEKTVTDEKRLCR
jgi:hypothetical protein